MKNRILIIEPDIEFATRLAAALEKGEYQATIVQHVRDACLILVQQPQDLAFVPAQSDDGLLRALLALQPNLPLVGTVHAPHTPLTQAQRNRLKTLLSKIHFEVELPLVLEAILQKPVSPLFLETEKEQKRFIPAVDIGRVVATLEQLTRETGVVTIFTQGRSVLASTGKVTNEQATLIAVHCQQTWPKEKLTAQVQFYRLPGRVGELLLYTRPVGDGYSIILGALPTTPLTTLRVQARHLQPQLVDLIGLELPAAAADLPPLPVTKPVASTHAYAIVWRAREPLPDFLHIPLRRALERIANANACILTYFDVTEQHVHILVNTPAGRNGTWAAHLFKNGSEQELQLQFQVRTAFWAVGHYATESVDPLSSAELDLFLLHPLAV